MSKRPGVEDSTQRATPRRIVPKRQLSRWEKERKRRHILEIVIVVVIVAVVGLISYGYYATRIKPWHQPIVKVNEKVYDMGYFVKMLRLQQLFGYSWGQNLSQDIEFTSYIVDGIRDNELMRQAAEEFAITITDDEIEEEFRSQAGYDPENETLDELNQRVEEVLKDAGLSLADFKQLTIEPALLRSELEEAIGNEEYPEDEEYEHVQVRAVLLGTEEEAEEIKGKWDEGIDQLVEDYSPNYYYPKDSVEWIPRDIESSAFEDYVFNEGSVDSGVSEPIRDTTYSTTGGYWLVMVLEKDGEGEEETIHIQGILLDSEEEAEEIAGEFNGENFAELAEEYSLHSSSKGNGGDMDWLSLDDIESQFGEDNLDVIQALALETLSDPVYYEDISKQSGYWVIEVLEKGDRELIEDHRNIFTSQAFSEWLDGERNSEENEIVNYLDDEKGYERILWAIEHVGE